MDQKIKIFAVYAWEDKNTVLELLRHMKSLKADFDIEIRYDDPIHSHQPWKPQIESRLHDSNIFLLLVSKDFMKSPFINQIEFKNIIDRYKADTAVVVPIIVDNCHWDIDFKSDDYDFNLKELQVLPEEGKPISDWNTQMEAYKNITGNLRMVISSMVGPIEPEKPKVTSEKDDESSEGKEQLAIRFAEEKEAQKITEEQRKKEAAEVKKIEEEQNRQLREAEAKRKAEEQDRIKREAEAKRRAEAERLIKEEAQATAKLRAEEEIRQRVEAGKRKAEEAKRLKEEAEIGRANENREQKKSGSGATETRREAQPGEAGKKRKRVLWISIFVLLAAAGIWAFSVFNTSPEKEFAPAETNEATTLKDSIALEEPETTSPTEETTPVNLAVGDSFEGGIVFAADQGGKTGKIAHLDDAGPMPWKEAMEIHEKLGEGWRLPTMDELKIMYRTIGQGADNSGKFQDELYWSTTPYDANQARLLRFRDGNTSYHYNSNGTHRKFLVRAVRDF